MITDGEHCDAVAQWFDFGFLSFVWSGMIPGWITKLMGGGLMSCGANIN